MTRGARQVPLDHRRRSTDQVAPLPPRRWVFERRVSLDTIVGIVGIAIVIGGPFIVWGRAMEGRVLAIEVRDEARTRSFEKIEAALERLSNDVTQARIALAAMTPPPPARK